MGGRIEGSGSMGVDVSGNGTVTLSGEVKVEGFETGMKVTKGSVMVTKGSITGQN
ncbi:hypothetical protein ME3_01095 [Bartonella melophagi K-2C]|uniref:Uncharacterized protein n=1 Tax=Bartonella melophagi K-2C TaxID=1094557 RepID=J1JU16_9HYPH|nr:hypothetical protein ME3_01095 [Bartonella melophagi K-2C]